MQNYTPWFKLFALALILDRSLAPVAASRPDYGDATITKREFEKQNNRWADEVKEAVDSAVRSWITHPGERTDCMGNKANLDNSTRVQPLAGTVSVTAQASTEPVHIHAPGYANFTERIREASAAPEHCPSTRALLANGNCMVLALSRLLPDDEALEILEDDAVEYLHLGRSYDHLDGLFGYELELEPSIGCNITEEGDYLLHCGAGGCPHCVAVRVRKQSGVHVCEVYDGPHMYRVSLPQLHRAALEAIDGHSLVTFRLGDTAGTAIRYTDPWLAVLLLELQAGGRSSCIKKAAVCKRPSSEASSSASTKRRLTGKHKARQCSAAGDAQTKVATPEPTIQLLLLLQEEIRNYISELVPYSRRPTLS